ncbi:MAG: LTA synthase family protein [Acidobacteriota bacterium]
MRLWPGRRSSGGVWVPRKPPAQGTFALVQPSPAMVAYTEGSLLLGVLIGVGIRLRIFIQSPLRPAQPAMWTLNGLAQDVAIYSMAGALALFSTRYVWQRRSWSVLTGFVFALCLLHLIWSEIVTFFGHAIRARDLQVGLRPVLFLQSVRINIAFTLAALLALSFLLIPWTARRARRAGQTWATAPRLLVLSVVAVGLSRVGLPIHQSETARNPVVAFAVLIHDWPATDAQGLFRIPKPTFTELSLRYLAPRFPPRDFFNDAFPLAYRSPARSPKAPRIPQGIKPNLVFILMEGVRSEEIGVYGGIVPGLTPNLDELARQGTRVHRFYSNGNHTPEGELALWYGLLPSPYEVMLTTRAGVPMTGLPEMLRSLGWKSFLWIHNGDQNFYSRDRFYLPRGFRTIDGKDFPPNEPRTSWGFSDRTLMRHALKALDVTEEPFAAMVLTVSNHHPFQLPSDAQTRMAGLPAEQRGFQPFGSEGLMVGMHTVPMLKTIHYTDEAIGYFFGLARTRPWFANTVFVIASDHGLPIAPLEGVHTLHRLLELRHRVPLIIYSPLLPPGKVVPGPASQIDVLPTLAGLFGIPVQPGLGRDLLDPDSEDPERPVITWTRDAEAISIITKNRAYHRMLGNENPIRFDDSDEEILVDPVRDPEGEIDLMNTPGNGAELFARAAHRYFDVYPWLVVEGRSGLPSAVSKTTASAPKGKQPASVR